MTLFSQEQFSEMEKVALTFEHLGRIYQFYRLSGQSHKIGKVLVDKAISAVHERHYRETCSDRVERILSANEVIEYLNSENSKLEEFAAEIAERSVSGIKYGQFQEGHGFYEPIEILSGKRFSEQITAKLDKNKKAFTTFQDKVIYDALHTFLHWNDESFVKEILKNKNLKRFQTEEKTRMTAQRYVLDKLERQEFETLENAINSSIGYIFSPEIKALIAEAKDVSKGGKKYQDLGDTVKSLEMPLLGFEYQPEKNDACRAQINNAIRAALGGESRFNWTDLEKNSEVQKYLENPDNRRDFLDNTVAIFSQQLKELKKTKLGPEWKRGAKEVHISRKLRHIYHIIADRKLFGKIIAGQESTKSFKTLQKYICDLVLNGINSDYPNSAVEDILGENDFDEAPKRSKAEAYISEYEIKKVFESYLQKLIKRKRLKRISETCLDEITGRTFLKYVPKEEALSELRNAVDQKKLSAHDFFRIIEYGAKAAEKRNYEKRIWNIHTSLEQKIGIQIAYFTKDINACHPYGTVLEILGLDPECYNNSMKKEIMSKVMHAAIRKNISEGNFSYAGMLVSYLTKGVYDGAKSEKRDLENKESFEKIKELFEGEFPINSKMIKQSLTHYFSTATKKDECGEAHGESALLHLNDCISKPAPGEKDSTKGLMHHRALAPYISKNKATEPYFNILELFEEGKKKDAEKAN